MRPLRGPGVVCGGFVRGGEAAGGGRLEAETVVEGGVRGADVAGAGGEGACGEDR